MPCNFLPEDTDTTKINDVLWECIFGELTFCCKCEFFVGEAGPILAFGSQNRGCVFVKAALLFVPGQGDCDCPVRSGIAVDALA